METALITPPIGVNLYVVQGIRAGGGSFNDARLGAAPFVIAMPIMIAMRLAYPELALWLPRLFYRDITSSAVPL
jgi:TRAP-type C4-dicarboxylate transport system permease large subunit